MPPSAWQVLCGLEATMNLTPAQEQYIVTLSPGEATVFADGAAEPRYLALPYRWTLVLEALQQACRDGHARLHAVIWGQRPAPALERAAGARAGDPDWTERVASLLEVFAGTCRWPLDYLTPPGQAP